MNTWKVHNLKLDDGNKHKYWALTCKICYRLMVARADHVRANEVRNCTHTDRKVQLRGPNWAFVGG